MMTNTVEALKEPSFIASKNLSIQELTIGDSSCCIRLTIWADGVGKMEENKSYQLHNVTIREFSGKKILSTSKNGSTIKAINDLDNVEVLIDDDSRNDNTVQHLKNVRIVGVQKLDAYYQCLKCAAKVTKDDDMGECLRCSMVQSLSDCHKGVMACVIVKSENNTLTLRVFDKVITAIMDNQREVTPRELLRARPFGMHFQDGIIRSIRRS